MSPRDERDGAEGAHAVAPFGNLEICAVGRGGDFAVPRADALFGEVGEGVDKSRPVELAEKHVDFRHLFAQGVAITLGQAAHGHDLSDSALLFEVAKFEEEIDRFLLGVADETAGVDYDIFTLGRFRVMAHAVAPRLETADETFGINEIFRTSHRDDVDMVLFHFG